MTNGSDDYQRLLRLSGVAASGNIYPRSGSVLGIVDSYDDATKTYVVITQGSKLDPADRGRRKHEGVPRMTQEPGDNSVLPADTNVVIDYSLGIPVIKGVIAASASKYITDGAPDIAPRVAGRDPADTSSSFGPQSGYYRSPSDPVGLFTGDWCRASPDGNFIAALRGKLCKVFGNEQAQVIVSGLHNLVRTVCENYQHFSSFGELRIENNNGRVNLSFRGAADQLNESGGDLENWTFHLDIGDKGQLFNMRITSADGRIEQAQFKITPDGEVRLFGKTGFVFQTPGRKSETIGGDSVTRITGGRRMLVEQTETKQVRGSRATTVNESDYEVVGNDQSVSINRNQTLSVGGQFTGQVSGGSPLEAKPTNVAYNMRVLNGSYQLIIGDILSGANPLAYASYHLFVNNGHVIIGEDPQHPASGLGGVCSVNLNTLSPGSIGLGCIVPSAGPFLGNGPAANFNPQTDSAMLYNKWLAFANTLIQLLDSHIHQTAWGPSLPAEVPPGTQQGFKAALSGLTAPVKSIRVFIGA